MSIRARLELHDTVFISDGRPFHQDDEGLAQAESVFPPLPIHVFSCLRASVAEKLGALGPTIRRWDPNQLIELGGNHRWTLGDVVGDGWGNLGCMRLNGVRVLDFHQRAFFPCPRSILAPKNSEGTPVLAIVAESATSSESEFVSDLHGDTGVAGLSSSGDKALDALPDMLISEEAFSTILAKGDAHVAPNSLLPFSDVFVRESYVGIGLSPSKVAISGQLYSVSHFRAKEAADGYPACFDVELSFGVSKFLDDHLSQFLMGQSISIPLGGRGRSATVSFLSDQISHQLPTLEPNVLVERGVRIYSLAPIILDEASTRYMDGTVDFLDCSGVRLRASSYDRPRRVSGWDSSSGGRTAWSWMLPAGAVFECSVSSLEALEALRERLLVGGLNMIEANEAKARRIMGFGDAVLGAVPTGNEKTLGKIDVS